MKEPFIPAPLPRKDIDWSGLISSAGEAQAALARYDGRMEGIVNPHVLLAPLLTQEAVLSSKIEGTQATLEEVLEFEADPKYITEGSKHEDIKEIINYRRSLVSAEIELEKRPLCLNLIKKMHSILLNGVRGQDRSRGEFRVIQNWIGKPNSPIEEATYVPPPPDRLPDLLSNLEEYCHYEEKDRLVQLALIHGQFELIHPFLDGNGRIGRLLIPIFLYEKKLLGSPKFYISAHFESTRDEYYARLQAISKEGDWKGWITYFLTAITKQAIKNSTKAKSIMDLYDSTKETIYNLTRSQFAIQTLDFLFNHPIFHGSVFANSAQMPRASAARIINVLHKGDLIRQVSPPRGRKPALYIFPELLKIVQS